MRPRARPVGLAFPLGRWTAGRTRQVTCRRSQAARHSRDEIIRCLQPAARSLIQLPVALLVRGDATRSAERISEEFGQVRRADHAYVKSHGRSRQDAEMLCSYSAAMVPPCCRVSFGYPTEAELPSWSDWMSIDTASIKARWVNACGKLPRCWPVVTSISSA